MRWFSSAVSVADNVACAILRPLDVELPCRRFGTVVTRGASGLFPRFAAPVLGCRVMGNRYDEDLVLWAEEQGRALRAAARAGWNAPIDWENVAEEIETFGRSERHALASRIAVVVEHLMKLQVSPATDPARGWRDTIRRARREIQRRL